MADEMVGQSFSCELTIEFPDDSEIETIRGDKIVQEKFTLTRSICDDERFKFGGCIAACAEVELLNVRPDLLIEKKIKINFRRGYYGGVIYPDFAEGWDYPSDRLYPGMHYEYYGTSPIFIGVVESAERQKDKSVTKITAYDALHYLGNKNIYDWFSDYAIHSGNDTTYAELAGSLIGCIDPTNKIFPANLNFEHNYPGQANRKLSLDYDRCKSVFSGTVIASELLSILCEYSGEFGVINPEGGREYFEIVRFGDLTAPDTVTITSYESLSYDDFITLPLRKYYCKYGEDKWIIGDFGIKYVNYSAYDISNPLLDCIPDTGGEESAWNFMDGVSQGFVAKYNSSASAVMTESTYRPFECTMPYNNNIKLGDRVKIQTTDPYVPYVEGYVLQMKIQGIAGALMTISAQGTRKQEHEE